jgi:hypothetical protein
MPNVRVRLFASAVEHDLGGSLDSDVTRRGVALPSGAAETTPAVALVESVKTLTLFLPM